MSSTTPTVLSAEAMKGRHVLDREGEDLGKIQEVMIDLSAGRVAYAVMSFGGFLGIGARMVAIPWGVLHPSNRKTDEYVADLSKDLLKEAPSFSRDKWPSGADRSFLASLYTYYGYEPYWNSGDREEEEAEHIRMARQVERHVEEPDAATPATQPVVVETTVIETTTTEYGSLGEVGGIGGEDLSAGMGTAAAYDEVRSANADDMGGVLSDTDMTDERWRSPRNEDVRGERISDFPRGDSDKPDTSAREFEDMTPGSEVAFGTTSGDENRYADTTGSDEPLDADIPVSDAIPEGQGNTLAFEGQDEEGSTGTFRTSSGFVDVSGASGISSARATGGSEGISAAEDLSIGSVDDLNTIGSTLGLEQTSFEDDEYSELPGEGSRRGSSSSGDFRTNDEDMPEQQNRPLRSGRGHSSGQSSTTHEPPSMNDEEDDDKNAR